MSSGFDWPDVGELHDHWAEWRPEWTASRERLLWYLTFGDRPEVVDVAREASRSLPGCGVDVVPPDWLHLTLEDLGFADEVLPGSARAAGQAVQEVLADEPPVRITLGPVSVLPGAVVLVARPVDHLRRLRALVRGAGASTGLQPVEAHEELWPHVSLGYVNGRTDHQRVLREVDSLPPVSLEVTCDRLVQVQVIRANAHYRWRIIGEVRLGNKLEHPNR